jgi:TonB-dependent receptor
MRKFLCFLFALMTFSMLAMIPAAAQDRRGAISGHVTDATQAVVQGARVEVQPGGQTGVSDGQGQFVISGLAPGRYIVTVSAIGFAAFSSNDVAVTAGGVVNVDAVLKIEATTQVVEVRADRERGEVEALNRERTADNILEVLPADVITSLPNTNIADAVGRLNNVSLERDEGEGKYIQIRGTEPRLSNVTVDGVHLPSPENVRNVKLDAIPADLVESVELSKTLQANQEGDAIGGSVNLVTKSATDRPYISAVGIGGYTPIAGGRSLQQFDLTMGKRFFSDHRLGIIVGGGYDWNGRGIDDVEPSPGVNGLFPNGGPQAGTFNGPNTYDQREYWYDRTRFGFGGTLDYRFNNSSGAYLRGLFSQFKDDGQDWIYSPTVGSFSTPTLTNADGSSSFTEVTRKPSQRLFSAVAGARHEFGRNLLNYEVAVGQARFTGFFPTYSFDPSPTSLLAGPGPENGNLGVQYSLNTKDPFVPVLTALNANIFDPKQYVLANIRTGDQHTFERDVTGAISLSHSYNVGPHFSILEGGFKVRDAHKSNLTNQTTFSTQNEDPLAGPVALMSAFTWGFTNPNYYFGNYGTYGPTTDYRKIAAFFQANPSFFSAGPGGGPTGSDLARTLPADFNADERVTAGYLMNTITFGNSRLQAGVRVEGTSASFLANQINVQNRRFVPGSLMQVPGSQSYVDVLPSVQYQYRFGSDTVLRLAYGMGIARPNFGDLPPHLTFDPTVKAPKAAVSAGNPNLKPTHAQDFDVMIEHYLKPFGVIEAGFFYKYLTDPIYSATLPLTTGQFAGSFEGIPINGPHAYITGLELAWQQRLSFLPGFLNGSGVRANYSYTNSRATFPAGAFSNRTDQPNLQRQAPNNWNFDYTYDKKGVSTRLGVTHNDANIFSYGFTQGADGGLKGPNGDTYLYPHTQVDVQASYWIPRSHGFQVVGYVLNLTNETFGFYNGSEQFPIQREYYNRTYAFGMRWTMGREHN